MDRRTYLSTVSLAAAGSFAGCTRGGPNTDDSNGDGPINDDSDADNTVSDSSDEDDPDSDDPDEDGPASFTIEPVTEDIEYPWGFAFWPETSKLLVTELDSGRLLRVDRESGESEPIEGTPSVDTSGQGGLLDVALHPDFPAEPWVYLTYSAANGDGETTTHLGRGRLAEGSTELSSFETLHAADPFVDSSRHYGSRVVFGSDGAVYMTVGDRQFKDFGPDHVSQDTTNELGTTLRLEPDGTIPADNPFLEDPDVVDSIFSYGHRNAQGMTVHPETGELWQSEHGEQDGDEINIVEGGQNYGWPITHYGCTYSDGEPVGEQPHERDDVVDPVYYWECNSGGFPPSGATFYDGDAFPEWRGDLFVGNLAGEYLGRFSVDGREVEELDPLLEGYGWRIRAVESEPETGHLYVAVDGSSGPLIRLVPE